MPLSLDRSPASPQQPIGASAANPAWWAGTLPSAPACEAPLVLPRDWDLLDPDQRVRTIGEW